MENEVGYEDEDATEPIHNDKEILLYVPQDCILYRIVLMDQKYTAYFKNQKVFSSRFK